MVRFHDTPVDRDGVHDGFKRLVNFRRGDVRFPDHAQLVGDHDFVEEKQKKEN